MRERVEAALAKLGARDLETCLAQAGIAVVMSDEPAHFGTAIVRGYYLEDKRTVVVCTQALDEEHPVKKVLAHEAFHVLDPDCPVRLAEPAARLFAEMACAAS